MLLVVRRLKLVRLLGLLGLLLLVATWLVNLQGSAVQLLQIGGQGRQVCYAREPDVAM
jgi:hypothetical protein